MPVPKWIVGHAGQAVEDPPNVGLDVRLVVGRPKPADPAVEELDDLGAGLDLGLQVGDDHRREPVHQAVPGLRLAEHEGLGQGVVTRRAALDEVAGQGERGTREADDPGPAVELAPDEPDRVEGERDRAGVERQKRVDRGGRADRLVDDRPDLGLDPQADAHRLEGQHDVGEHDRRIDPQLVDRHEGHLGAQLGCLGQLEDAVALAQGPIGREAPARLAHEPDRGGIDRLEPAGSDEPVVHAVTARPGGGRSRRSAAGRPTGSACR